MKLFKSLLFVFTGVASFTYGISQKPLIISAGKTLVGAASYCSVLKDDRHTITYDSLLRKSYEFEPYNKPYVNLGITPSAFWIKLKIVNTTNENVYIEIGNTALDSIIVFERVNNQLIKHISGNWEPYMDREVQQVNYLFLLHTKKFEEHIVYLKVQHSRGTQFPLVAGTYHAFYQKSANNNLYSGMYYGLMLAMIFYNLFIYFSLKDPPYLYYVLYTFFMGLLNATLIGHAFKYLWPSYPRLNQYVDIIAIFVGLSGIMFVVKFLETKQNTPFFHKLFKLLGVIYLLSIFPILMGYAMLGTYLVEVLSLVVIVCFFGCAVIAMRKNYRPAKFFIIAWSLLLLSVIIFILKDFVFIPYHPLTANALQIGSAVEALLLSMALANRINIYKKEKENAQLEAISALNEKKQYITEQNLNLERQVEARTSEIQTKNDELENALNDLKVTQAQLIQREKMASLGELTTGIAHEIQNPLNFVTNFSDVTEELVDELIEKTKKEVESEATSDTLEALTSLKQNIKVINVHGKRADLIVKSMLQHSQPNKGMMEPTDINLLVDEYLKLSYIGFKSKNKDFNAKLETDLQKGLNKIDIVPQDIARVLVNLFNNALYALQDKMHGRIQGFEPELLVSTKVNKHILEIHIRDNGTGIPSQIIDKIFQPFYTTKPSGKGTGLGLSISYDIITKEHGGELTVLSKEHEFTDFVIKLPIH
ncbi:MAG: GHKL domain-containing protein [Chitinophagaceae bacterium]|nr:GHKL domain-containing protein [Chitinophagaceae bacterium]